MSMFEAHQRDDHGCGCHAPTAGAGAGVDPVCRMTVDPGTAEHAADVGGVRYYFCAAGCRKAFLADPPRYLTPSPAAAPVGTAMLQVGLRSPGPADRR